MGPWPIYVTPAQILPGLTTSRVLGVCGVNTHHMSRSVRLLHLPEQKTRNFSDYSLAIGGRRWYALGDDPTKWDAKPAFMRIFTGQYDRTIDGKNRLQLPSQIRAAMDPEQDGNGLYVMLGQFPKTLSLYTEARFQELATRMETEFIPGRESLQFELQFYGTPVYVEIDKQGRIVLPDRLRKKARLGADVYLVGQKTRLDLWNRADFERELGIDWEGDDWPDWQGFLRSRPGGPKPSTT